MHHQAYIIMSPLQVHYSACSQEVGWVGAVTLVSRSHVRLQ